MNYVINFLMFNVFAEVIYCDICSNTPLSSTFETLVSTTDELRN